MIGSVAVWSAIEQITLSFSMKFQVPATLGASRRSASRDLPVGVSHRALREGGA
jgi:hypothetical protein